MENKPDNIFWEINNNGNMSTLINVNQIVSIIPINKDIHLHGVLLKMSNNAEFEILNVDYCDILYFLSKNENVNIQVIDQEHIYD